MRESVQTKLIPEHVVTTVKYIAFDGQEFAFKDQCEAHEKQLLREAEIESHPVIKTAREVELYPDMNSATLYYIPSDEEYEFLMNYLKPGKAYQDDYKKDLSIDNLKKIFFHKHLHRLYIFHIFATRK